MIAAETTRVWEYAHPATVGAANGLALDGWELHSVVPTPTQILWVMRRQVDARARDLAAELDRVRRQVQRVRDLHRPATTEAGLPGSALPRCVVCKVTAPCDTAAVLGPDVEALARMTPGEQLRVRRSSTEGGMQ